MDYYELTLQRETEIEDGLLKLMESTAYGQITVTDLAKHLGMSRKCFYNYFPGKETCFESLTNRLLHECALYISTNTDHSEDYEQVYLHTLQYWQTRKAYLEAVVQNNLGFVLVEQCTNRLKTEEKAFQARLTTPSVACDDDVLLFYIGGQVNMLLNWCRRDFTPSAEEMARKFLRLLHSPLIQAETEF